MGVGYFTVDLVESESSELLNTPTSWDSWDCHQILSTLHQNIEDKLKTDFWYLEWFGSGMSRGNTFMVKKGRLFSAWL